MQHTYKAFYKGKTLVLSANTSYHAQIAAAVQLKAKRPYEVTIVLLVVDGEFSRGAPVVHDPAMLPGS